ncbi:MAG: hypothetical protein ACE15D_17380 [Candidatus Eisenbacteria bacterium]
MGSEMDEHGERSEHGEHGERKERGERGERGRTPPEYLTGHHRIEPKGLPVGVPSDVPPDLEPERERRDVSIRGVLLFMFFFVVGMLVVFLVVTAVDAGFGRRTPRFGRPRLYSRTVEEVPAGRVPPPPWEVGRDLARMREQESRILDSFDWVDRQRGIARIPIERAIEILASRGLPDAAPPIGPEPVVGERGGGAPAGGAPDAEQRGAEAVR